MTHILYTTCIFAIMLLGIQKCYCMEEYSSSQEINNSRKKLKICINLYEKGTNTEEENMILTHYYETISVAQNTLACEQTCIFSRPTMDHIGLVLSVYESLDLHYKKKLHAIFTKLNTQK